MNIRLYLSLFAACAAPLVAADTAPRMPAPTRETAVNKVAPELPARPKDSTNYASVYVFIGTVIAATAGLLASAAHTGRPATPAEKGSATGNVDNR